MINEKVKAIKTINKPILLSLFQVHFIGQRKKSFIDQKKIKQEESTGNNILCVFIQLLFCYRSLT